MTSILNALKSDLLSRRLLPFVVLVTAALIGAIGYAVLGGSSAKAPAVASAPAAGTPAATATPAAVDPNEAVSETPSGAAYQRQGGAHDPFVPLPKVIVAKKKAATTKSTKPAATTPAATGGSSPTKTTSTPTPTPKPAKRKPTTEYQVAVLFGAAPAPGQAPALTPYENLKLKTPLPSTSNPLLVYRGVSASGKGAIFVLINPPILSGKASCLPSANQCEAIVLAEGQTEELSYLQPNGVTVTYQLQLVSISKHEASSTGTARVKSRESSFGRKLLRRHGTPVLARLRFVPDKDVVVFLAHKQHTH
jgi:hypothetical protein